MRPFYTDAHGRTVHPMALSERHDDEELGRAALASEIEHADLFDVYEGTSVGRTLNVWAFLAENQGTFERHMCEPAP